MITRNTDYSIQRLRGLSTDTKPVNVPNGSEFREMDTGKKFLFSAAGTEWIEQPGGGGGSVEPLIVNITDNGTARVMDKKAIDVYNAFIGGTPVVFYDTSESTIPVHPVIVGVMPISAPNGPKYYFALSYPNPKGDIPDYYGFLAPTADDYPSYDQGA